MNAITEFFVPELLRNEYKLDFFEKKFSVELKIRVFDYFMIRESIFAFSFTVFCIQLEKLEFDIFFWFVQKIPKNERPQFFGHYYDVISQFIM